MPVKVGDEVKFFGQSERPFLVTRIDWYVDSVIVDGIYSDGSTLSDVEIFHNGEWLIKPTGRKFTNIIKSISSMGGKK